MNAVCCQAEVSAMGRSFVQGSPGVFVCVRVRAYAFVCVVGGS